MKRKTKTANKSIRLCSQAIVANFQDQNDVKKIQIDMLPTEHKKLVNPINLTSFKDSYEKYYKYFLNSLLCRPISTLSLPIQQDYTDKLFEGVAKILDEEPTLLNVTIFMIINRLNYLLKYSVIFMDKSVSSIVSLMHLVPLQISFKMVIYNQQITFSQATMWIEEQKVYKQ